MRDPQHEVFHPCQCLVCTLRRIEDAEAVLPTQAIRYPFLELFASEGHTSDITTDMETYNIDNYRDLCG